MAFHVFLFVLVCLLIVSLALLYAHGFPLQGLVQSRAEASMRSTLPRLLKPRTPTIAPSVDIPPRPR